MQLPFGREIDFHSAIHIREEENGSSLQSPLQKTSVGERGRKERSTRLLLVMMMETASQTLVTMVTDFGDRFEERRKKLDDSGSV